MNYQSFTNFSHTFIRRLRGGRRGAVRQDMVEGASALEQEKVKFGELRVC